MASSRKKTRTRRFTNFQKGYARFVSADKKSVWTSRVTRVQFGLALNLPQGVVYDPEVHRSRIKVWVIDDYGQKANSGGNYCKPHFKPEEFDRMKEAAKNRFEEHLQPKQAGTKPTKNVDTADMLAPLTAQELVTAKKHKMLQCKACIDTRIPCTGYIEALDGVFYRVSNNQKFKTWIKKLKRLKKQCNNGAVVPPDCLRLYHQTSPEAAAAILESQLMYRGEKGLYGGGIYFALSPEATEAKAHSHGAILECIVYVGEGKVVEKDKVDEAGELDFLSLSKAGFHSVHGTKHAGGPSCDEHVVYSWDQVLHIKEV